MTRLCSFTTRGCHFDCEFCSVSPFNGKTTRRRPVPEVIAELRHAKEWLRSDIIERMTQGSLLHALSTSLKIWVGLEEGSIVAFVDDLHNSHRAYCRELWEALKSLNIKWGCQSTMFLGRPIETVSCTCCMISRSPMGFWPHRERACVIHSRRCQGFWKASRRIALPR